MKKVFFVLFLVIKLCVYNTQAQTTAIPDTNFEQKLIQLGIDSDGLVNGLILNSDAVGITKLDVSSSNIQSLIGIGAFINLDTFHCSNNQIVNLDFSNNNKLTWVSLLDNQITTINISNSPNLKYLDCSMNQLTSLDLSNNLFLEELACTSNSLIALDVSNNSFLEKLYCFTNQLEALNVGTNTNLERIICNNNKLTSLDLSGCVNLKMLQCHLNNLLNLNVSNCTSLWYLWAHYNQLFHIDLTSCTGAIVYDYKLEHNQPNLKICLASLNQFDVGGCSKDPSAVFSADCFPLAVVGNIVIDDNNNCVVDSIERGRANHLIQFANQIDTFYFSSYDTLGSYRAYLDTGTYTVTLLPGIPYVQVCPASQIISIDTNYIPQQINWTLQVAQYCPYLEASLSAPFLRMTGGGSNYTISYNNKGTAPAYNAFIEVEIDTFLNVLGTSIPIVNQIGNKYTFDLDTINVGEYKTFTISVIVDTSAQSGQTHCSSVHIYPDSLCNNTWTGPLIEAKGICNGNGILFEIENIGSNMLSQRQYSIFEDLIVLFTNPYLLNSGSNLQIPIIPQPGKTYRIEVEQAAGFPASLGPPISYANVQNCNGMATNPSIPLVYYNGNPTAWIDNDCQANISSYDPNDKQAQQLGYGSANYIERAVPLDYKIRFQNTGNDTAFNIIVLDTLSDHLDLGTLQMKAASHNYTWEIVDNNTLKVTFANIKLVDSLTNEPLSHGFFRYEIDQKANLPLGTVIENTAAIYFDYNSAIFTNTTFHTINENFVLISVNPIMDHDLNIKVYPNPFHQMTTIELTGQDFELLELQILDITGKILHHKQVQNSTRIPVYREQLTQGVYFFQLKGNKKLLYTGKLVVL